MKVVYTYWGEVQLKKAMGDQDDPDPADPNLTTFPSDLKGPALLKCAQDYLQDPEIIDFFLAEGYIHRSTSATPAVTLEKWGSQQSAGTFYSLGFRNCDPTPEGAKRIIWDVYGILQDRFDEFSFSFRNDDGTALIDETNTAILNDLRLPIFEALEMIAPACQLSEFEILDQSGFEIVDQKAMPRLVAIVTPKWESQTRPVAKLWKALNDAAMDKQSSVLWIPNDPAMVLFDIENSDLLFLPAANAWQSQQVVRGKVPLYQLKNGEVWSAQVPKGQSWTTSGEGGRGAMRCDRANEYEYRWEGDPWLAIALGMNPLHITRPWSGDGWFSGSQYKFKALGSDGEDLDIDYYKRFITLPKKPKKKNEPKDTIPLRLAPLEKSKRLPGKTETFEFFYNKGFVMKQKGSDGRGLRVVTPRRARVDASRVMDGSATQFATDVLARDPGASTFWRDASKELEPPPQTMTEDQLKSIRTDQEWCHLFGHGDGGQEIPGNFVSGSKHCNTEQLAIETAQRIYRSGYGARVTVKVTAYLMPAEPIAIPLDPDPEPGSLAARLLGLEKPLSRTAIVATFETLDLRAELTDRARSLKLNEAEFKLPTAAEYDTREERDKKRLKQRLLDFVLSRLFQWRPLAYQMRYKIYVDDTKVFDHAYAGQREEMDYFQYKMIHYGARAAIAARLARLGKPEAMEELRNDLQMEFQKQGGVEAVKATNDQIKTMTNRVEALLACLTAGRL